MYYWCRSRWQRQTPKMVCISEGRLCIPGLPLHLQHLRMGPSGPPRSSLLLACVGCLISFGHFKDLVCAFEHHMLAGSLTLGTSHTPLRRITNALKTKPLALPPRCTSLNSETRHLLLYSNCNPNR